MGRLYVQMGSELEENFEIKCVNLLKLSLRLMYLVTSLIPADSH